MIVKLQEKAIIVLAFNVLIGSVLFIFIYNLYYQALDQIILSDQILSADNEKLISVLIINSGFIAAMGISIVIMLFTSIILNKFEMLIVYSLVGIVNMALWYSIAIVVIKPSINLSVFQILLNFPRILAIYAIQSLRNPSILFLYTQITYNGLLFPVNYFLALTNTGDFK